MLSFVLLSACDRAVDPDELLEWRSTANVVIHGAPGRNRSAVVGGGAIATDALGWRIATRHGNRIDVWRPTDEAPRTIELPEGWDPGQAAIVAPGRALVALRGTGSVLAVELGPILQGQPVEVCGEPRGIAVDAQDQTAWVACRTGELVHLTAEGEVLATFEVEDDLRDVVVDGDTLWVSRLREAEVLRVDPGSGGVLLRVRLETLEREDTVGFTWSYEPRVAWRMVAHPDGGVAVLHQLHQVDEVQFLTWSPYYGPSDPPVGTCDGIVLGRISRVTERGVEEATAPFAASVPFDLGFLPDGRTVVAATGFPGYDDVHAAVLASDTGLCSVLTPLRDGGEAEMGSALVIDRFGRPRFGDGAEPASFPFYQSEVTRIACASCHPDGGDDGQTWILQAEGSVPRRTPSLRGGLLQTAPFHWEGDLGTLTELWSEVAMGLMARPDSEGVDEMGEWLDGLSAPLPSAAVDADLATRGAVLFADPAVGCADCHTPPTFTNNETMNVGTGERLQVPSLRGVSARLPVMHDGCAETLRDRFTNDACGGGDRHGVTSQLTEADIDALVAYLESL